MSDAGKMRLRIESAGLLVIDVQDRLAAAMQPEGLDWICKNIGILMDAMAVLKVPVIITEQYPKGLGPTVPEVSKHVMKGQAPISKVEFSCCESADVTKAIESSGRTQWIVTGMESHVCVYQTARDLIAKGMSAFVVYDGIISRTGTNYEVGVRLMERAGAYITSTETMLFDLLHKAGTPEFRELQPLVK